MTTLWVVLALLVTFNVLCAYALCRATARPHPTPPDLTENTP